MFQILKLKSFIEKAQNILHSRQRICQKIFIANNKNIGSARPIGHMITPVQPDTIPSGAAPQPVIQFRILIPTPTPVHPLNLMPEIETMQNVLYSTMQQNGTFTNEWIVKEKTRHEHIAHIPDDVNNSPLYIGSMGKMDLMNQSLSLFVKTGPVDGVGLVDIGPNNIAKNSQQPCIPRFGEPTTKIGSSFSAFFMFASPLVEESLWTFASSPGHK